MMSDVPQSTPSAKHRPLRVLYLNPFSQQVSGPDESLLALLSGLIPLGIEPHVVLPMPGPQVPRYESLGARVYYTPLTFLKRHLGIVDMLLLLPRLARGVLAVSRIARRERIDLIHTNMEVVLEGSFGALLLRLPHVLHYRGNTLDSPKLVFDVLTRFWTWTSRTVICISHSTAEIFRKRGLGERVVAIYNPVDVKAFAVAKRLDGVRTALGAQPDDILVGTVGRIHPRKDMATFLRALALASRDMSRLRGVIVGVAEAPEEIEYRSQLEKLAVSLGIEKRLCWAGPRHDMPNVLKALDIFVLASRHEGFGRVVAEASAAGLPMVLSREGALPELASGDDGCLLADVESPEAFAASIRQLACRPSAGGTSECGRLAQQCAVEHVAARVKATYEASLG